MPSDTTKAERKKRIDEVIAQLGLSDRRHVAIKALSGGQLKRVSIGVELITKPTLFFLDEATSGLDPGTERKVMQLLRQLADEGRTIFLITHATENISLCDRVIFLAKGGKVAYFGKPQDAPNFFGVSSFTEIYGKVEDEKSPDEWQNIYKRSPQYQKVIDQQKELTISYSHRPKPVIQQAPAGIKTKQISGWRQFLILSHRNFAILIRDRASLILMLAIAPILGLLDFLTWKSNIFNIETGDPGQAITMLFTTGLISVMVGSLATMREIVKEVDIYRRERMIGLMIIPYILSKVSFCVVLALYQAAIFLLFKNLAIEIPGDQGIMYITLFLGTMAGMMMGLLVSAISPNQNMAPLLTIIFLVPQIIFGGGILPISEFGAPGKFINQISLTKWPFESLVTVTGFGEKVAGDRCWQVEEAERKKYTDEYKENNCTCLGARVFERCEFPGLKSKYDKEAQAAVESAEPTKPKAPGAIPTDPLKIKDYEKEVNQYNDSIKDWQENFSDWKGKRESAIARAEGLINRFNTDYGSMFKVDVPRHWASLGLLILGMFVALIVIQKRKDIV
jgi:ABC transport system ATP-binding/permease protein